MWENIFRNYIHIPYEKRTKLNDKSESFIFIDYDDNSKGYKLCNSDNKKIMISRDVVFDKK